MSISPCLLLVLVSLSIVTAVHSQAKEGNENSIKVIYKVENILFINNLYHCKVFHKVSFLFSSAALNKSSQPKTGIELLAFLSLFSAAALTQTFRYIIAFVFRLVLVSLLMILKFLMKPLFYLGITLYLMAAIMPTVIARSGKPLHTN